MGHWYWQLNRLLEMWSWPGRKIRHDWDFRKDQICPIRRNLGPFIFLEAISSNLHFESHNLLDQPIVAAFFLPVTVIKANLSEHDNVTAFSRETIVRSKARVLGRRDYIVELALCFPGVLCFGKALFVFHSWLSLVTPSGSERLQENNRLLAVSSRFSFSPGLGLCMCFSFVTRWGELG